MREKMWLFQEMPLAYKDTTGRGMRRYAYAWVASRRQVVDKYKYRDREMEIWLNCDEWTRIIARATGDR